METIVIRGIYWSLPASSEVVVLESSSPDDDGDSLNLPGHTQQADR